MRKLVDGGLPLNRITTSGESPKNPNIPDWRIKCSQDPGTPDWPLVGGGRLDQNQQVEVRTKCNQSLVKLFSHVGDAAAHSLHVFEPGLS